MRSTLLAIIPLILLAGPAAGQERTFDLDAIRRVVGVSSPAISPDGLSVVIVVSRPNFQDNRFDNELVLVDVMTGERRALTHQRANVTQPQWSPDGRHLAFLAQDDQENHQVWVLPMEGGEATRRTDSPRPVQQFAWRPDGEAIAYVTMDEEPNLEGEAQYLDAFEAGYNDLYLDDPFEPSHIWLVPSSEGQAKRLTSGAWSVDFFLPPGPPPSPLSWSPDGSSLAFVARPNTLTGHGDSTTVRILDVASGDVRPLTGAAGGEATPAYSPDGETISLWSWASEPGDDSHFWGTTEVRVTSADGGAGRSLTRRLDRNTWLSKWMPDGGSILTAANDKTTVGLWHVPLDGQPRRIDLGNLVINGAFGYDVAVGRDGQIAFPASTDERPAELYWMASAEAEPRRLTDYNEWIGEYLLGSTERVTWQSDEFTSDGVVIRPPDFDANGSYPLVLYIHGGPMSASKQSFSTLGQVMAGRGWVVFQPNYRGSDNLGNDYQIAIVGDAGAGPGRDVMAGVDMLVQRPYVDGSRMAVTGWSYWGYMTTWLAGNYPDRWDAAMAGAAVTDLRDQYNLADFNVNQSYGMNGLSPWTEEGREAYRDNSPITYATNITAPTLIMSATRDFRVPVSQSFRLFHALEDNGVETSFILYPGRTHFPSDPVRSLDVFRRWVEWVEDHFADEGARPVSLERR